MVALGLFVCWARLSLAKDDFVTQKELNKKLNKLEKDILKQVEGEREHLFPYSHRLAGLVVKVSASTAADLGSKPAFPLVAFFPQVESYQ